MEVAEVSHERKHLIKPANQKDEFTRKYIQPPRAQPFAPLKVYCPPTNPIDSRTTYYSSYYAENQTQPRSQPIKPIPSLSLPNDKFSDDTTFKMTFKPVWGVSKAKPIVPSQRLGLQKGRMEDMTTIRQAYSAKWAEKPSLIIPCGNIRSSKGPLETATTTLLSYANPGLVQPVTSFKPKLKYCEPNVPTSNETTQKLSYLPYEIGKKENHPWAQKPVYRRPEAPMPDETTYAKSYLETKPQRESPIVPKGNKLFESDAIQIPENTVYRESFLPCQRELVAPIKPCGNIALSDKKMSCDTTSKMSFQPVKGEKRKPILPRQRFMGDKVAMQNVTTTQLAFTAKIVKRPGVIVPSGQIHTSNRPLEAATTTALSYVNPGPVCQVQNYKPDLKYCKPVKKVEGETVNKLSYREWSIGPKEELPWAQKGQYCRPKEKILDTTVYHSSFPPPGQYVDCNNEESSAEHSSPADK